MADETNVIDALDPGSMSAEQVDAFMDKGDLPDSRPEGESSGQTSAEVEAEDEGSAQTEEPAERQTEQAKPHMSRAERRNQRISQENRELRARIEALERGRTETPPPQRQQETRKTAKTPRPELKDYPTWEEWFAKDSEWQERRFGESVAEHFERIQAERSERETAEKAQRTEAENLEAFNKRGAEYLKTRKGDDFPECLAEVAESLGSQHQVLAREIRDSEFSHQLVDYFADNMAELDKFKAMSESGMLKALGQLELKVKPALPKTKTSIKRTASDLGGRGGSSDLEDQISEALTRGDSRTADRLLDQLEAQAARR